jgi:hypothetical protein
MIIIPAYISREFIEAHPEWNFVYPTNFWQTQRVGPALICTGLPNCFGVPVRWTLCKSSGYFQDAQFDQLKTQIDLDIAEIPRDKPIVLFPKIGCGNSRMHILAPKTYLYLHEELDKIAAEVVYDYTNTTT